LLSASQGPHGTEAGIGGGLGLAGFGFGLGIVGVALNHGQAARLEASRAENVSLKAD
jgi:hypothetical protein